MRLPNLELLYYKATQEFAKDEILVSDFMKSYEKVTGFKVRRTPVDFGFDCEVFKQTWGSTVTAFDVTSDGQPTIGGSAMTDAYTVVFLEHFTNTAIVCVDDRLCYMVRDMNDNFFEDLKDRNLASLSCAKKRY